MTSLVTGAGGFIGSAVVRALLARGQAVRVLLEPDVRPTAGSAQQRGAPFIDVLDGLDIDRRTGDLLDGAALRDALAGCDRVYHLAAIYALWTRTPARLWRVNVEGTAAVLAEARRAGAAVVHCSSIAAIGAAIGSSQTPASESTPFTEADHARGNDYIRSKWLAEQLALREAQAGANVVIVNPAFPFGPRDVAPTPTGRMVIEALHRRMPALAPGGFCVIDVDDLAQAIVTAGERGRRGERYILGCHNVDFSTFYAALSRVSGVRMPTLVMPAPLVHATGWVYERIGDLRGQAPSITLAGARQVTRRLWFDTSKARAELALRETPLEDTLERAVRWFRDHGYAP